MANVFIQKSRYVVPNFRSFSDTVALGELSQASLTAPGPLEIDLEARIAEWKREPTVGLAGDLVSAALVSGDLARPEIADAAHFVVAHPDLSSHSLTSAANKMLSHDVAAAHTTRLPRLASWIEDNSRQRIFRRIRKLKTALTRFTRNPILFTELARLYLIVGNEEKAKRNIAIALSLAPHNRYVLRSAVRLYAHCNDAERGFNLLHRNPGTRHDPWLASAELAMASLIDRSGTVVKPAARILMSTKFSPFSLTELRAGVGSVELLDGDRRGSKRLFEAALEKPNDNALAQVEWALSLDRMFDVDLASFNVSRNYEAHAIEAFNAQQWDEVIRHCESWLVDMPFASRPALMASHVASVVLDNPVVSQMFSQAGLLASPRDPALLNGYAYALALDGKPDQALQVLDELPLSNVHDARAKVYLTATRGLACFRGGRIDQGRLMYAEALDAARSIDDPTFRHLALLNYIREELMANQPLPESLVSRVRELKIDSRAVTTQILKDKVVALLDERSATSSISP